VTSAKVEKSCTFFVNDDDQFGALFGLLQKRTEGV
jgi:hypothetical protein